MNHWRTPFGTVGRDDQIRKVAIPAIVAFTLLAWSGACRAVAPEGYPAYATAVEEWGVAEIRLHSAHLYKNPFIDVHLRARFSSKAKEIEVNGFYDGEGIWKVRFMPETQGQWTFRTISNDAALDGKSGAFIVESPKAGNHGPVRVAKTYHFSYADGTPYFLLGTTSYNWVNGSPSSEDKTLAALARGPFTKLRFGLFPLWYDFNHVDPTTYPYVQIDRRKFDFDRFNPVFFRNVEQRLRDLQALGVVADIILFMPYDDWGFARMDAAHDDAYIRYAVSRLGAFRNVWWTMANEYNLFGPEGSMLGAPGLPKKDWDRMFSVLRAADPYSHERTIHNAGSWYDASKPWITHISAQEQHAETAARLTLKARKTYGKPVVIDEYGYEGNSWPSCDLSPTEGVSRHWKITMAGGYASHGECYLHRDGGFWWSTGEEFAPEGPARLGFIKEIMTGAPFQDLAPSPQLVTGGTALAKAREYYLFRFTATDNPAEAQIKTEGPALFKVELIDPWQMKVFQLGYTQSGVQAFRPLFVPSLLQLTATARVDRSLPVGSIAELLANITGEKLRPEPTVAAFVPAVEHYSTGFTLGELIDDSRTQALLVKYAPGLLKHVAVLPLARGFPLALYRKGALLSPLISVEPPLYEQLSAELAQISVDEK